MTIKNGDLPASPVDGSVSKNLCGVTKRELFAAMAMQGLLARQSTLTLFELAELAVCKADALLMVLERTK